MPSADYPASSPFVTAVGGTSLKIGKNGHQSGQLGWATGRSFKCTANVVGDIPGCTAPELSRRAHDRARRDSRSSCEGRR